MKEYDVAIIGAGTAGLSARREVSKYTDNYVVIDDGPLGTTCARVGCMPSKVFIQVANDFHRRLQFERQGIRGANELAVDIDGVMKHVRSLRDRFVRGVLGDMAQWSSKLLRQRARLVEMNVLEVGQERIKANRIVIATGSSPIIPEAWKGYEKYLFDTNDFFEKEKLPSSLATVGLGVIGLELGQALSRLGIAVHGITLDKRFGGLSDPTIQDYVHQKLREEFSVHVSKVDHLEEEDGLLKLLLENGQELRVEQALVAMGRRPNLQHLGIEELGIPLLRGVPEFDRGTFRIKDTPWYLAGDVNQTRPVLHEAADEGRIAGYNSVHEDEQCFKRRTALTITFSDPNIALVGKTYSELKSEQADFVVGEVSYEGQGRAIVKSKEVGLLRVYAERQTGRLLGSEMFAPEGEHLAHMLAWVISSGFSAADALSLPFYHPVLEEGVRTALRSASLQTKTERRVLEVLRCADPPVGVRA